MNIRNYVLILLYATISCTYTMQETCHVSLLSEHLLNPYHTIIAFDIDEVILTGREAGYKQWLAEHSAFAQYVEEVKNKYKITDAHAIIDKVAELYPELSNLAHEFKRVIISAPAIPGTVTIIHELAKRGYSLVTASNMTTSTYESMVADHVLPTEFTKDFYFVSTSPLNKKSDDSYYAKPSKEYYENLVAYINQRYPHRFTHIIFIDDKVINVEGAALVKPIEAIHFTDSAQLKKELLQRGVIID